MNTQQAYQDAKKEYDDVKAKLERLDKLSIKTELSVAERKEFDRLEKQEDDLKKKRDIWEVQVRELQLKLPAAPSGNDFVTRALGT